MTTKTAEQLRAESGAWERAREESFERSDTDGFLTQWACGLEAGRLRLAAEIAEAGGTWTFRGLYRRSDGKRVRAKLIETRFGWSWAFCDANGRFTGRFVADSKGTTRSKLWREGYEVRDERAPAEARTVGRGYGLSGSAWTAAVRTDGGYPPDAE